MRVERLFAISDGHSDAHEGRHRSLEESWRNWGIPGAVLTEWVGIGLLLLLFATVLAGIWMVLVYGMSLPPGAICLRG